MRISRKWQYLLLAAVALAGLLLLIAGPRKSIRFANRKLQRARLLVTGHLVDAGGHRLHIECTGTGSPTVIADSGLNSTLDVWSRVVPGVAQFTRVCTYERLNVGLSDRSQQKRTGKEVIADLHNLLAAHGVSGPYIMMGHSAGGVNIRYYAHQYPSEIAGLVLVDSSHEGQYPRFAELLPPGEKEFYIQHERGGNDEHFDLEETGRQLLADRTVPAVPIVVISTLGEPMIDTAHRELQAELARSLPNAKHVIVQSSNHYVPEYAPEVIVTAVREVFDAAHAHRVSVNSK